MLQITPTDPVPVKKGDVMGFYNFNESSIVVGRKAVGESEYP